MEQTTVSMVSLFENNILEKIRIYFINMGISKKSVHGLEILVERYGHELIIIDFDEIAYDLKVKDTGRHIKSVYAKLFFSRIKDIDKILYLDSDTVIIEDISKLYNMDMKDKLCAGVMTLHDSHHSYIDGLNDEDIVINDGVVLLNLDLWRKLSITEKCIYYIERNKGEPPVLSEGTINTVCRGKIVRLHPRYNLMSGLLDGNQKKFEELTCRKYYTQKSIGEAIKNPCIIHFLSGFYNRPWCTRCTHPMKNVYLEYRNMTEWEKAPLQKKKLGIRLRVIGFLYRHMPIRVFIMIKDHMGSQSYRY